MSSAIVSTVGALIVATCLSCFSCGIVVSLAGTYFARFPRDKLWIRLAAIVGTLWAIMDTVFNATWAYKWGVTYFMQIEKLALLPFELTAYCFVMSTAVLAVQLFYLYRLFAVSNRNWVPVAVLGAISFGCYGIALYMGYVCSQNPDNILAFAEIRTQSWGWFGGVGLVDLSITALMFWYLVFKPKRESGGMVKASSPLKQVVLKAAQTNALSAVCQIAIVILYATYPTATFYTLFGLPEVKIYIGSFLATLNARSPHASGAFDESVSRTSRGGGKGGFGGFSAQQPVHVTVRQEVNIDAEDDDISLGSRKDALGLGEGSTRGSFPATAHYATAATPYRVQFDRTAGGDAEVDKGRPLHVPHNAF
ncbi:hypothetical protein DMC30DRAFT_418557 [Rhodotorula diobovata]|uniref:DUF6534 domain-containing protein n=1 Tax=Rhodotorula diobovata TaxID=5288 RepID=A0A5C5FR80_9BASI|nr:hypothetical protein DMC30DRAFT_418557 [Rhodotorula diobovata]